MSPRRRLIDPVKRAYSWFLWDYMDRYPQLRNWYLTARGRRFPIFLDYPVKPKPRYGYSQPPHAGLSALFAKRRDVYEKTLRELMQFRDALARISVHGEADPAQPAWVNGMLPGLDGASIYGFLASRNPRRYFEVGSGNSTRFARRAIRDQGLRTEITSIDPHPRVEIDAICDRVIRSPLEEVDTKLFDELEAGDVLFVDNSHRAFQNSDVTVVFLEIVPSLKPGVLVGIHDINLPYDYGPDVAERYYSEQYVLAAHLLAAGDKTKVVLPAAYAMRDPELSAIFTPLWSDPRMAGVETGGAGFWFET